MRIANIQKMGFYPIPEKELAAICTLLNAPAGGRVLDPCMGEGVALATIATTHKLQPYGIERHELRAAKAAALLETLDTSEYPHQENENLERDPGIHSISILLYSCSAVEIYLS